MDTPLQITFADIGHSDAIEARVRKEIEKLGQFDERISSAEVLVARPQHRHRKGSTYEIRIHFTIPGGRDIVVSRDPGAIETHEDVYVAIRDAFKAARRQLQDLQRRRQGKVKQHEDPPNGRVAALHPETDHGFIAAADGREIYFHRNSVAGNEFDKLDVGQEVRFAEAVGDKGPRATLVRPVGKHHFLPFNRSK